MKEIKLVLLDRASKLILLAPVSKDKKIQTESLISNQISQEVSHTSSIMYNRGRVCIWLHQDHQLIPNGS